MKIDMNVLKGCPLFLGISHRELGVLLKCLSAKGRRFDRNEFIYMEEDAVSSVCIVISGCVHIILEDYWGSRTILAKIDKGGLFAEALCCLGVERFPVSVTAAAQTEILFIDYARVLTVCSDACAYHMALISNMVRILAQKNIMLTEKLAITSKRTIREKLLAYLSAQAKRHKSPSFVIPFDRQELADYLCADRSALSRELGCMQKDGLISFSKNRFTINSNNSFGADGF